MVFLSACLPLPAGSCVVVNADTLETIVSFHHRKEEISDVKFSPSQYQTRNIEIFGFF